MRPLLWNQIFLGVSYNNIRNLSLHSTSHIMSGVSLGELPKSHVFTTKLPPDPEISSPEDAEKLPRPEPRIVRSAAFTWIKPETVDKTELLAVSPVAMQDIGLKGGEEKTEEFQKLVSGNKIYKEHYPWAQCYGGFQFGTWAGQLGDGRAISLFESTNPSSKVRYELQLKGAGMTPYSRFADGKAVLRSSIREFIVSEALNALNIPTTRALSLTFLPETRAVRETSEPCAIVCRFAQSWIRLGTFDLQRSRGDRNMIRKLADYVIEEVYGGVDNLAKPRDEEPNGTPNRYELMYRKIVQMNAKTVGKWQAYGFMNGVLNTDNTSILGLSLDFGPFSFMDTFDPTFTPNHDDHTLRYSYKNQPTIIWWNLVRFGEGLAELFASGDHVDDEDFIKDGVKEEEAPKVIKRAEEIIRATGDEYKEVFLAEYKESFIKRLGFQEAKDSDLPDMVSTCLELLEDIGIDFNHFFRRLSSIPISKMESEDSRTQVAKIFLNASPTCAIGGEDAAVKKIAIWLGKWRERLAEEDGGLDDERREKAMKAVNPKFVPKNWVLDEVIDRVQNKGDREILKKVLDMSLKPFEDEWGSSDTEQAEAERLCGDVPQTSQGMQCSCSS